MSRQQRSERAENFPTKNVNSSMSDEEIMIKFKWSEGCTRARKWKGNVQPIYFGKSLNKHF